MDRQLMQSIESEYKLNIRSAKVIHDTQKTFVCKLVTDLGTFALKTLYRQDIRQQFIVDAEAYLIQRGIHIPNTLNTSSNQSCARINGHPYVLQEWIFGQSFVMNSLASIEMLGALLGRIHKVSLGFHSPAGALYDGSKKWEIEYQKDLQSIEDWDIEHKYSRCEKVQLLRKYIDYFSRMGIRALSTLCANDYYHDWIAVPLSGQYLCHGDFHTGNILTYQAKHHIIDWEDVRYDFPSKDISRVLFLIMRRKADWDPRKWRALYHAYLGENSLTDGEKSLLFIDLVFPHMFERYLRKKVYEQKSKEQVQLFLQSEKRKTEFMYAQMRLH